MTIATYVTLFRLSAVILIVPLIYQQTVVSYSLAGVLFMCALASDAVDGYVARKFNQVSELGTILDPLVDKVLVYVVLFSLLDLGSIEPALVFLMFVRDMVVDGLRNRAVGNEKALNANIWGKAKFSFQCLSVICSIGFCITTQTWFLNGANAALLVALLISLPGVVVVASASSENTPMERVKPTPTFPKTA